ncbi:ketosteroid isomerase-like protein [Kribbella sp. VKM Ac-2571]|uniref:nuclear transport factor 2 family protein n=1 Tax=Kribbella sp. VKM Ac-2571 TaxID=2512222 RepID=UPI00105B6E78|nr:nuclear transport factor 2 family protein [Kribbella sp. VKM Ac-2571]TDO68389.1 ketosteroid isomerase-like protein [Kribbella sp. VKM Ac-2571]
METIAERFVAELVEAVNGHDLEKLTELFAPDYVNETPAHPARGFTGNDQVRRNWASLFAGVPDIATEVMALAVAGDTVWTEWKMDGTRRDGAEHHMRGVVVFTVESGRATAARFYLEPLDTSGADVNAAIASALHSHSESS